MRPRRTLLLFANKRSSCNPYRAPGKTPRVDELTLVGEGKQLQICEQRQSLHFRRRRTRFAPLWHKRRLRGLIRFGRALWPKQSKSKHPRPNLRSAGSSLHSQQLQSRSAILTGRPFQSRSQQSSARSRSQTSSSPIFKPDFCFLTRLCTQSAAACLTNSALDSALH